MIYSQHQLFAPEKLAPRKKEQIGPLERIVYSSAVDKLMGVWTFPLSRLGLPVS